MRCVDLDVVLDDPTSVEDFRDSGFLAIERFLQPALLDEVRVAYDEVISGQVRARQDRMLGGIIRQVRSPSTDHPFFVDNDAIVLGRRLAAHLFGGTPDDYDKFYEMLIDKPAGTTHATPWHQDIGYFGRPVAPEGLPTKVADLQIWVALDPVDVDNGCMQFLARPYGTPALEHVVASGDPDDEGRLLSLSDRSFAALDLADAVACDLPAGGATVHLTGTPHYTGPNRTDRPRRAYIFNIAPRSFVEAAAALYPD